MGEGENTSNQHFLLFLCCSFKDFFLSGIKSRDCLGEESNAKKRNKTMFWLSLMKSFFSLKIQGNLVLCWKFGIVYVWFPCNFNSLPSNKTSCCSKLKAFADNKINVTEKLKFVQGSRCRSPVAPNAKIFNKLLQNRSTGESTGAK